MDAVGRQRSGTYEAESVIRCFEPTEESGGLAEGDFAFNWSIIQLVSEGSPATVSRIQAT